jgi:hypothetical protein
LFSAVLGSGNVGVVSPTAIKGDYTAWGEGSLVNVVEEIRLHGENRYALLDKVKPYITNAAVPIRRMRTDEYKVPNVTAYVLFTNHQDALPLNDAERRFCILATVFQTKQQIDQFNAKNPQYFARLFAAVREHRGALRKWLLNHEISDDFEPYGHAPFTDAKQNMMDAARGDETDDLEALLENSGDPMVNCCVLNTSRLKELAAERMVVMPSPNRLSHALTNLGYTFVGRAFDHEGKRVRLWSKYPTMKGQNLTKWLDEYVTGKMFDL